MCDLIEKILQKENVNYKKIERSNSGFTNKVYFVDDEFVVKVVNDGVKPEKIKKEISFYKNVLLDFIPRYISSGQLEGVDYLIIKKIKGQSLYGVWHRLTKVERGKVLKQIVEILKTFHKQNHNFLSEKFIKTDWSEMWQKTFQLNINILEQKGFNVEFLKNFKEKRVAKLFKQSQNGLIYNDAHFDNFIYDNKKVYLIDFDRVMYCSIDYELLIIKQMLDNPTKFANEEDESKVNQKDYDGIYESIKMLYPEMFAFENIEDRVFIYQFIYNLGNAFEYNRNDWIEKELNSFKQHFGVQ